MRLEVRTYGTPAALLLVAHCAVACGAKEPASDDSAAPVISTSSADEAEAEPSASGDDSASTATSSDPAEPGASVVPTGERIGHFDLAMTDTATSFSGNVYSSPIVDTDAFEVVAQEGDCEVQVPKAFACLPACGTDDICAPSKICVPVPKSADVGEVLVSGVQKKDGTTSFGLKPLNPTSNKYNVAGLAVPPFAPGDAISLDAPGGALQAFQLQSKGIAPLVFESTAAVPFESGKPSEIRWVAGDPELARVIITIDVGHHGGSQAEIVCKTEDTGSVVIAASLVDALMDQGVSGFPLANVERRVTTYANLDAGYVELNVGSYGALDLSIPGIISCGGDAECPEGQYCKMPNLQCVPNE